MPRENGAIQSIIFFSCWINGVAIKFRYLYLFIKKRFSIPDNLRSKVDPLPLAVEQHPSSRACL